MYKYFPHTEADLKAMLEKVGCKSLDDLYAQIPEDIRFRGDYDIPLSASEQEVRQAFQLLGSKTTSSCALPAWVPTTIIPPA